ncbi:MAG: UDP-N-acetylmuramoyl-L-alanyl-D-glutamate--2,6-diaminopimelate ligase [Bacteroidota bacterium]
MKLSKLIRHVKTVSVTGDTGKEIRSVVIDNRQAEPGSLFIAIRGTAVDGHRFIPAAIAAGCIAVVCEEIPEQAGEQIAWIRVADARIALAAVAAEFYGNPSHDLKLIGVTGTNGKTTIATLLYKLYRGLGYKAGLLSTVEVRIEDKVIPATHTTPDPLQLNRLLREMADAGCGYCFMEVSSHAAAQHRIGALLFRGGIFTNLTHDHLDYHPTFRNYLEAKKSFFDQLGPEAFALTNADDKNGMVMLQNCRAMKESYSIRSLAGFRARIIEEHIDGTGMELEGQTFWTRLPGRFNVSNVLAVYGAAVMEGQDREQVKAVLSGLGSVRGRFETLQGSSGVTAVVDYAHTPDAVMNVLETISGLKKEGSAIITVVGAGGNRDKTKRPKMAAIAATYSQKVILTSDNPRDEDPEAILQDMLTGITPEQQNRVLAVVNREEAIKTACLLARPGDVILVAGKGHETYQEVKGVKNHFDDREVVLKYLK